MFPFPPFFIFAREKLNVQNKFQALIFDMDGVLIDSERLWRIAMIQGFGEVGIPATEEECRQTMGMRFPEVVALWLDRNRKKEISSGALQKRITSLLIDLINTEGKMIEGIAEIISICKAKKLKMGLATSSSHLLMHTVLKKLNLEKTLHAAVSAEHLKEAKPHPEVFLNCAKELGVHPAQSIAIEDSVNGVRSAKAAGMTVIAVPEDGLRARPEFTEAHHRREKMIEVPELLRSIL
jgi:beta-phosphoglucomutase-like phosphatase (HAD superfamily)